LRSSRRIVQLQDLNSHLSGLIPSLLPISSPALNASWDIVAGPSLGGTRNAVAIHYLGVRSAAS
jgi:hypothetical protein